jgi:hypothetical protein
MLKCLPIVMRGLDPRIDQKKVFAKWMDCRVKPGNDGWGGYGAPLISSKTHSGRVAMRKGTALQPRPLVTYIRFPSSSIIP